jgi:hypothetical protein
MKTVMEPAVKKRIVARLLFAAAMLAPVLVVAWRMAALYSYERRHPGLPLDADGMVLPAMYLLALGAIASVASFVLYARSLVENGRVTMWRCLELAMLPLPALPFLLLVLLWFSAGTPVPMSNP